VRIRAWSYLFLVFLAGCKLCDEQIKSEAESPDGKYIATLFERDCGATTDFVAHVNMRETSERFVEDSNGTVKQGEVFVVKGRPMTRLVWKNNQSLVIECTRSGSPFRQESSWHTITILYELRN